MDKLVIQMVCEFITEKLTTLDIAHMNLENRMIVIMKELSLLRFKEETLEITKQRIDASIIIKNDPEILQRVEDDETAMAAAIIDKQGLARSAILFITEFGKKYPLIDWEGVDIKIRYNGLVSLDITAPTFFDNLSAAIDHVLAHDDLKAFVL